MEHKKRIPCLQDLLISEIKVRSQTQTTYRDWFSIYEECINLFFEILYLKGFCNNLDETSVEYEFMWYAQDIYTELPCALQGCTNLFNTGHYTDALKCCRTMLETLVKLKFFYAEKENLSSFLKTGKDKFGKFIKIKKFFESAAPKAYEKNYSFLCSFVHKGFATCLPSMIARLKPKISSSNKPTSFLPLPSFNDLLAEIVFKHLLFLVFGYLNAAPHFLSPEIVLNDEEAKKFKKLKRTLHDKIKENNIKFSNSTEWCQLMEELVSEPCQKNETERLSL